jgi:hypothetical protein
MNQIVCEECDAKYEVLSDLNERPDYCPFCGEFIPLEPDGWYEEYEYDDE